MKTGLVSILICTYNAAETIEKTLRSCLDQTYEMIEILIHDDQSSDDTLKVIESVKDSRVKIIVSWKKLGPYRGLNFLLDVAQGEYIAIQDHDDVWNPQKLEKQIHYLEAHPSMIGCGTKTLMYYEADKKWFEYYLGDKNYYTIHPSLVFRNSSKRYPENITYMTDAYFQKKILCDGKKLIHNIDQTLTLHLVKSAASNYSYKRFTYSRSTLHSIFGLHPWWYGLWVLFRETKRRFAYPVLKLLWRVKMIDWFERVPFVLLGNKIESYPKEKLLEFGLEIQ